MRSRCFDHIHAFCRVSASAFLCCLCVAAFARALLAQWTPEPQPGLKAQQEEQLPRYGITGMAFSRDGAFLALIKGPLNHETYVRDSYGRRAYLNTRCIVEVWAMPEGKLKRVISDFYGPVFKACLSPDGKTLVTASWEEKVRSLAAGQSHAPKATFLLKAWDVETGDRLWMETASGGESSPIEFSPDGSLLAVGGHVTVFDSKSGSPKKQLGSYFASDILFSPDGKMLAILQAPRGLFFHVWVEASEVQLLNTVNWKKLRKLKDGKPMFNMTFSGDGKTLATRGFDLQLKKKKEEVSNHVTFWDVQSGRPSRVLQVNRDKVIIPDGGWERQLAIQDVLERNRLWISSFAFLWDGALAAISKDARMKIWDPVTLQERYFGGYRKPATSVAISPDGSKLALAAFDMSVVVWDFKTKARVALFNPTSHDNDPEVEELTVSIQRVSSLRFPSDGKRLVSASGDSVRVWDLAAGSEIRRFADQGTEILSVALSADSGVLASGSAAGTRLWDLATGKPSLTLENGTPAASEVQFSPDGKLLAAASRDGLVRLWDARRGMLEHTFKAAGSAAASIAFSPNGLLLACASGDGSVRLWEVASGNLIDAPIRHNNGLTSIAFAPDSKLLAASCVDGSVQIWDISTAGLTKSLRAHKASVNSLAFSPDGTMLATISEDRSIKLWNTQNWKEIRQLKGHDVGVYSVAFSPDGKTLAAGTGNNSIVLWDPKTGEVKLLLDDRQTAPVRAR
jgi:WD40 repeat protein